MAMLAPSRAARSAIARPMPRLPPVMKSVFPSRVAMWPATLSPRSRRARAHVTGPRTEELARAALLGDVSDPPCAAADAEQHLTRPGRKSQRVGDREETHVQVGGAEVEPGCLAHQ